MPKKHSLIYESVLDNIKAELIKGTYKSGEQLPTVAKMAKNLGVGQASVREAYRVLETLGILEVAQGRGTFVSASLESLRQDKDDGLLSQLEFLEQQSVHHLLETRKVLEPEIAALAAERATPAEIEAIMTAAGEMEELLRQGLDFVDPDVRFHELIFIAAHNPVLSKILFALRDLFLDSRRFTNRIEGGPKKAVHFHQLIATAIKERNPEGARALMYQHIVDMERTIMRIDLERVMKSKGEHSSLDNQTENK